MKRLSALLFMAALLLPGLAMVPHGQHVFWVPESAVWLSLMPWAGLLTWWSYRDSQRLAWPPYLRPLMLALMALWALSAGLALRQDLSALALAEWLGYPLAFFCAWRLGDSQRRRGAIVALLLAYGILSTAYAALQALGWDDIPWAVTFGGRAGAFLGNPNFFGGHLALLLPLSLALALDQRQQARTRWGQGVAWSVVLALGLGLLLAQTRGAWIGGAFGCALVLLLAGRSMGPLLERNRRALLVLGALTIVGLGSFFALKPEAWSRVGGTFQGQDHEFSQRLFLMKKSAQLASLRPLWGVGPGNMRIQFPRVQVAGLAPGLYNTQPYIVGEHAHNDFLQMAAEAGIPAALCWGLLMGLFLWHLGAALRAPGLAREPGQGRLLALGVIGGLSALLVHGLANFPFLIVPTQAAAWALLGLALRAVAPSAASREAGLVDEEALAAPLPGARPWGKWNARLLLLAGALACGAATVYNGRRLAMDRLWWIGQGELSVQHPDVASPLLLRALALDRREDRLWNLHGQAEMSREMIWNSIGSLREAHRLAPYDPDVAVRLGRALVENKQYAEAEDVLSGAADYAPNFYDVWEPLAAALYLQGKYPEAVKAYDWMIYFNVNGENAYVNKAAAQGSESELPEALLTLKAAEQRYPDKVKVYTNEAVTYVKLGMRDEARAALKKALAIGPDDVQLEQLKKVLR